MSNLSPQNRQTYPSRPRCTCWLSSAMRALVSESLAPPSCCEKETVCRKRKQTEQSGNKTKHALATVAVTRREGMRVSATIYKSSGLCEPVFYSLCSLSQNLVIPVMSSDKLGSLGHFKTIWIWNKNSLLKKTFCVKKYYL